MSLGAELGGGLEIDGLSIELLAGIKGTLNGIHEELRKLRRMEEAYEDGPKDVPIFGSASSDSGSDTFEITCGGPAYGRMWQVRSLVIGGPVWGTTVAGTALVVVNAARNLAPATSNVRDKVSSMPQVAFYSTGQLVVRHPDVLRFIVLTPTASTQYVVGGVATEMPDKRVRITTAE